MKLTFEEMLTEANNMLRDDILDAQDRATLLDFYNGGNANCEGVNHLLGYDGINLAKGQIESVATKGKAMFDMRLFNLPRDKAHLREKMELTIRQAFHEMIKRSRRFKPQWKAVAGEIAILGCGSFVFRDPYDWCPVMARPYVPRGSEMLPESLPYLMLADHMSIVDLRNALKAAEGREALGYVSPWRKNELRTCIAAMEGTLKSKTPTDSYTHATVSQDAPDTEEEDRQAGATGHAGTKMRIPVFRFFVQDDDGSVSMTILPRLTPDQTKAIKESSAAFPRALFHSEAYFDSMRCLLHAFFVDCKIGGKPLWHRVLGLGRLNYGSDVEAEEFFNDAMTGARENLRRLYQLESTADWDMLKMWGEGNGPTNAIPPGVKLADVSRQPNMQHALQPLQMLMQLTQRNAASMSPDAKNRSGELEIQAMERQSRNAEMLAARMNDIYECTDALGQEMFARAISDKLLPTDIGYNDAMEFQEALRKAGISLVFLRQTDKNGRLKNINVSCSRAAGDGNSVKRAMANQFLVSRLSLFPAEAQQIILRRITAETTDDHEFAEQIVPFEPRRDTNQMTVSMSENDACDKMGILGIVPHINPDDLDEVHVESHMMSMEADLKRAEIRPWDQVDLAGFKAKGAHTMAHIQRMSQSEANKERGNALNQKLQGLAKRGQEHENNLGKQQEKATTPLSEKDKAELQLKAQKAQLDERKQQKLEEHRDKALALSAAKNAVTMDSMATQTAISIDQNAHGKVQDAVDTNIEAQRLAMEQQQAEQPQPQNEQPA